MKVYYEPVFYGYKILAKDMHPMNNCYVDKDNFEEFKVEVKRRFKTDDIEFIQGLENYFKDPECWAFPGEWSA